MFANKQPALPNLNKQAHLIWGRAGFPLTDGLVLTIDQANTARGMGELSVYTEHLRNGVEMAVTLKSQRRYQEAIAVYLQTPVNWLAERELLTLAKDVFGGQLPRKG